MTIIVCEKFVWLDYAVVIVWFSRHFIQILMLLGMEKKSLKLYIIYVIQTDKWMFVQINGWMFEMYTKYNNFLLYEFNNSSNNNNNNNHDNNNKINDKLLFLIK